MRQDIVQVGFPEVRNTEQDRNRNRTQGRNKLTEKGLLGGGGFKKARKGQVSGCTHI
jgi:hypothetical protein